MLIIIIVLLSILLIIYIVPLPVFIDLYLNDKFRGRIVIAGIIPISFPKKKKENY